MALERTNESAGDYAAACAEVALRLKIPCVNIWELMQKCDDNWSRYLNDGLHLSEAGNEFVAQRLIDAVNESYPDLAVHLWQSLLPYLKPAVVLHSTYPPIPGQAMQIYRGLRKLWVNVRAGPQWALVGSY